MFGNQTTHRLTTQVHVGLRLREFHNNVLDLCSTDKSTTLASSYCDLRLSRQFVNQHKTQIVTRRCVFTSGVTETDDDFHCRFPIADCRLVCPTNFSLSCVDSRTSICQQPLW